jgi:DNA-binding response OmpR family regulator
MSSVIKPQTPKRPQPALASPPAEDLSVIIQEARLRFMEAFEGHCEALSPADTQTAGVSVEEAVKLLHRMAGLGGTLGFPRVSAKAAAMEEQLVEQQRRSDDFADRVAALRAAYTQDVANPNVEEAPATPAAPAATSSMRVLLVEDEPVQRRVLSAQLRKAGHEPIEIGTGEEVVDAVRANRPDVILLDVELPGIDGYTVCRTLKADPELAATPVAFLSAHADVESRLTGLSHGAEDFLTKPIDPRELALRLELLARRRQPSAAPAHQPAPSAGTAAPPPVDAARRETPQLVLVADDDADVVRIVDAHLAAVGHRRILAYDGVEALEQARAQQPALMILDLMMPKLTGFDVLAGLRDMGAQRPKVLVLSARGRQEDVIRAFQLGADDFLVKPFNPQELLGRIARLAEAPAQRRRIA